MNLAFRESVAATLPSETRLRERLAALPERDWEALAELFAVRLPELDAVLAPPGSARLARALARVRGIPLLDLAAGGGLTDAALTPGGLRAPAGPVAVLVTDHLGDGVDELTELWRAERRGLRVWGVIAAIERSGARGRTRLELQALRVQAAVRLADTPAGLAFERRTPGRWPKVS
ncbi:hypothetical protein [Deinococcus budaensis]|uniref:Uncharacterized protein n=1 Tax=Deinococcus budaensis TaxID=1665626 RepID=A0A7W8LRC7_9DEIO|nr:hypothetical protein [Deinococcus budaensis]MBB5235492.1 hypothetical protein [Deinococcus budaensis]